ncbi:MAG: di-heme oxidoredictase family protein [Ignavibacteriota bacterium]
MREAVLVHCGEADDSRLKFESLSRYQRDSMIEFLKTLRVLPGYTLRAK